MFFVYHKSCFIYTQNMKIEIIISIPNSNIEAREIYFKLFGFNNLVLITERIKPKIESINNPIPYTHPIPRESIPLELGLFAISLNS